MCVCFSFSVPQLNPLKATRKHTLTSISQVTEYVSYGKRVAYTAVFDAAYDSNAALLATHNAHWLLFELAHQAVLTQHDEYYV